MNDSKLLNLPVAKIKHAQSPLFCHFYYYGIFYISWICDHKRGLWVRSGLDFLINVLEFILWTIRNDYILTIVCKIVMKIQFSFSFYQYSYEICCGLNLVTPIVAARGRGDFLAETVGRAAGTVLPGFFSPIQVHVAKRSLVWACRHLSCRTCHPLENLWDSWVTDGWISVGSQTPFVSSKFRIFRGFGLVLKFLFW